LQKAPKHGHFGFGDARILVWSLQTTPKDGHLGFRGGSYEVQCLSAM